MKWAKTKGEIARIREKLVKLATAKVQAGSNAKVVEINTMVQAEINEFYVELDDKVTLPYLECKGFDKWREVTTLPSNYKSTRNKGRYEAFVAGYLYYYENHVRKDPTIEGILYFDWGEINKKAELTIYLNPCFKVDQKTKNGNTVAKQGTGNGNTNNRNGNGKYDAKQKGKGLMKVWEKQGKKMQKTVIASPPSTDITDPPPPPPPPPPPKE